MRRSQPGFLIAVLVATLSTIMLYGLAAGPSRAGEATPKLVYLTVDGDRLIASNVKLSRFDELTLGARERIVEQTVGDAVIIVYTSQRVIGYGVYSGWRTRRVRANERIESIDANDYGALVTTNRRLLNFNGVSGVWAQVAR